MDEDFKMPSVGKIFKWGVGGVVLLVAGGFAINLITAPIRVANIAASSAVGVVDKTLDPNNVITRYEWFHDANGIFKTRVSQIALQKAAVATEKSDPERQRLSVELRGMMASCLRLANEYNANATKTNVSIFQGRDAPSSLSAGECG